MKVNQSKLRANVGRDYKKTLLEIFGIGLRLITGQPHCSPIKLLKERFFLDKLVLKRN